MQNHSQYHDLLKRVRLEYIPLSLIILLCPVFYNIDFFLTGITSKFTGIFFLTLTTAILLFRKRQFNLNGLDLIFTLFIIFYACRILFIFRRFNPDSFIQITAIFLLYIYIRNIRSGSTFLILLFFAGLIQGIEYILQIRNILPSHHYLLKGTGSFFNPSILALFLVISFLAGIYSFKQRLNSRIRLLWIVIFIFLLYCILIINSRAAWIALGTGCLWIGLSKKHWISRIFSLLLRPKRIILTYLLVLFFVGIIGGGIYAGYQMRRASVQGRFLIWQVVGSKLPEAFWLGHGDLQANYMPLQAEWFMNHPTSTLTRVAGNNLYAFNEFLRITFETGIIGLLLFCILSFTGCMYSLQGNRESHYAGSIYLSIVSFGLFGYPFSIPLIIAVTVITLAIIGRDVPPLILLRTPGSILYRSVTGISIFLFSSLTIVEYVREKNADKLLMEAQSDVSVLNHEDIIRLYKHLQNNPDFMLCYGKTLFNHKQYAAALPVLEKAYHLKPSSQLVCDLGMCYQCTGKPEKAERAYISASYMTPAFITPHFHLFNLYRNDPTPGRAAEKARYILSMPVKVVNTSVLRVRNQAKIFLKNDQSTD